MKRIRVLILVLVIAICAAAAWYTWAPRRTPPQQAPLIVLDAAKLEDVAADFNRAAGGVRVIVLLSPT